MKEYYSKIEKLKTSQLHFLHSTILLWKVKNYNCIASILVKNHHALEETGDSVTDNTTGKQQTAGGFTSSMINSIIKGTLEILTLTQTEKKRQIHTFLKTCYSWLVCRVTKTNIKSTIISNTKSVTYDSCNSLKGIGLLLLDFPGKNTEVGGPALLEGIFRTQGSNPCLLHCGQILCCWATREVPC